MGAYGDLGGRCKTQLRLNAPIIFFGPEAGTISTFDHRSVRLQFVHLHGTAPSSVRVITTSVSLTAERPFRLQGTHVIPTHVIPILFWSYFTIDVRLRTHTGHFFSGRSSNGSASMGTDLLLAFLSTAEHRLTRAILERHHARATSELSGRRSSLPFFFNVCLVSHGLY